MLRESLGSSMGEAGVSIDQHGTAAMTRTADMLSNVLAFACLSLSTLVPTQVGAQVPQADAPGAVTAIDILLEPDAVMIRHAQATNARLRKAFPEGFALDATHQPHVSCLQRYVRTADLDKVYKAAADVLSTEKPAAWKLKAYRYYFIPWKNAGLAGIVIEPTADLIRYQRKLIDAIAPFTVQTGSAAAFVTTRQAPDINRPTIEYVEKFVPDDTGEKFSPHVTVGLAERDYLKQMLDENFEPFAFSPVGAAVYKLGDFGAAQTKLKSLPFAP